MAPRDQMRRVLKKIKASLSYPPGLYPLLAFNQPKEGNDMCKPNNHVQFGIKSRAVLSASVAALSLLAGCVATVRVPPPSVGASVEVAAPGVGVEVQATEPPPPLPDYTQPPCPQDGWLWTPGYWAYAAGGYYWVPGTWVAPPAVGLLWTPGYWAFVGGVYQFHAGYWGPHIGFYGGVNYGFGYTGAGFVGGRWEGGHFSYNTAVVNVNTTVVHNTYVNNTVINNTTVNRVSFNGPGGVVAKPTPAEQAAMREPHTPATLAQKSHVQEALRNPELAAKANGGHPAIVATARPGAFRGEGVEGAKGARAPEQASSGKGVAASREEARAAEASRTEEPGHLPAPTTTSRTTSPHSHEAKPETPPAAHAPAANPGKNTPKQKPKPRSENKQKP